MVILVKALQLILSLAILVLLHEFGHFLFAKLFKTRVEKFYLFFNPWFSLFKFKKGETEYGVGWLPLGGYVKISGMIDESMDKEQLAKDPEPWEFRSKPAWQRLLIMVGGVLVNFLLALFIYAMVLFVWGSDHLPMKEAKYGIYCSDIAKELGLVDGDKVIDIDGEPVERIDGVIKGILLENASYITVEREVTETTTSFDSTIYNQQLCSGFLENDSIISLNQKAYDSDEELVSDLLFGVNEELLVKREISTQTSEGIDSTYYDSIELKINADYNKDFRNLITDESYKVESFNGIVIDSLNDPVNDILLALQCKYIVSQSYEETKLDTIQIEIPEDFEQTIIGSGIRTFITYQIPFIIDSVIADKPAYEAGIEKGDSLIAITAFSYTDDFNHTKFVDAEENTTNLLSKLDLLPGDEIIGTSSSDFDLSDITDQILYNAKDEIKVLRDNEEVSIPVTGCFIDELLGSSEYLCDYTLPIIKDSSSFSSKYEVEELYLIEHVNDPFFHPISKVIQDNGNEEVLLTLIRDNKEIKVPVTVGEEGLIGVAPKDPQELLNFTHTDYSFFESFPAGISLGVNTLSGYVKQLKLIFTKEGAKQVGGFGAIGNLFPEMWDWKSFWYTTALLSIILAFMNILPIPALDGGHVLFLLYEIITGRKPGDKFMEYAQITGMILLLALLVYANGNDIIKAFG